MPFALAEWKHRHDAIINKRARLRETAIETKIIRAEN